MFNKFVKYRILDSLLTANPSTKEMAGHKLDIYIDIQSVYKDILSSEFVSNDIKVLSINILNMAAHYRHYFRKRLGTQVRVFLVNSKKNLTGNICEIQNIQNTDMFNIVERLVIYFPDIYYIYRDGFNASSVMCETIMHNQVPAKFIISRDVYSYQMPSLFDKCFVLRPSSKTLRLITANNAIDMYFRKSTPSGDLSPSLIPIIMALNKCPELNLPLLYPYKTALNYVRDWVAKGIISQRYEAPNPAIEQIAIKQGVKSFINRWDYCDLASQSYDYIYSPYVLDETWMVKHKCDLAELAASLDSVFNVDPDNILNYVYLLD